MGVLECFEAMSGLSVNLRKNMVFLVGEVHNLWCSAATLGCGEGYSLRCT